MKLARLEIENFKGIRELKLDFTGPDGQPRPLTLLLGDNGSGKTTVLQAIALVLGRATQRFFDPAGFQWPGFRPDRFSSLGRTRIRLDVTFEADERELTRTLHADLATNVTHHAQQTPPGDFEQVTLRFDSSGVMFEADEGNAALAQFLGRYYLRELGRWRPEVRARYGDVGDGFWFHQNRSLESAEAAASAPGEVTGVARIRESLAVGWLAKIAATATEGSGGPGFIDRLESRLNEVFPGTTFAGVRTSDPYQPSRFADASFMLKRGTTEYDLVEMSSGEQAVFVLLYEFVRQSIGKSVVLIDELELHLHPPEQQALLAALRRIGPDCQFICTTHSPYLEQVTPNEDEVRLPGGRPCL